MERFRSVVEAYTEMHPTSIMQQEIVDVLRDLGHELPNNLPLMYLYTKPIDRISEDTQEMEALRQWYSVFDQQQGVFKMNFSRAMGRYIRSHKATSGQLLLQDFRADPLEEAFLEPYSAQLFAAFMKLILGHHPNSEESSHTD